MFKKKIEDKEKYKNTREEKREERKRDHQIKNKFFIGWLSLSLLLIPTTIVAMKDTKSCGLRFHNKRKGHGSLMKKIGHICNQRK